MEHQKLLGIKQLDKKLSVFANAKSTRIPRYGWVNNIRKSLNMTLEQLGKRLKITKQAVKKIETNEVEGTVTLNTLKRTADALDMQFIYGFIPKDKSVDEMITKHAFRAANKIVRGTSHNMALENQQNKDERIEDAVKELAFLLKKEVNKSIWQD